MIQRILSSRSLWQGLVLLAFVGSTATLWHKPTGKQDKVALPSGAIVLFSGQEEEMKSNFVRRGTDQPGHWKIKEGAMLVGGGDITTRQKYADYLLHVEFKVPLMPNAKGQARGNSGIGLQDRYEVQVLDSFGLKVPGKGDCGSVYNQAAPLINASKAPNEWQTYDIVFRRPRFDKGNKTANARVTVIMNGIPVQNNTEIMGATGIGNAPDSMDPGVIIFQDHHNAVEYRNIWLLPLPDKGSDDYDPH